METLNGLDIFVQTAQTNSFIATGRVLGISPSAVSKSIARLEERLGVRLFQRSTRTVKLTSEGAVFLERCKRILWELQAAEDDLSLMTQAPCGRLKVGLPNVAGLTLPLLAQFMVKYPEIHLDIDSTDRMVDVVDEGFDVVIRGADLRDSRLSSRSLGSYRPCIVASPKYLEARGIPKTWDDLGSHSCLHYRYPSTGKLFQWPLKQSEISPSNVPVPISLTCSNVDTLIFMALQGRGLACVPNFSVMEPLDDGRLVTILPDYINRIESFHIVWPGNRQITPKVRVFIDHIVETFPAALGSIND